MKYYEIVGCEPKNYGDVLMMEAVLENVGKFSSGWAPCVSNFSVRSASVAKDSIGLLPQQDLESKNLFHFLKNGIRRSLVPGSLCPPPAAVRVVIDVCGYKYGGIWGGDALRGDCANYTTQIRNGRQLVLMPKTFGPFEAGDKSDVLRLLSLASLCFVRDERSVEHLMDCGAQEGVDFFRYPDFTTSIEGTIHGSELFGAVIVPNVKMLETGVFADEACYLTHLIAISQQLVSKFGQVAIVAHHQGRDRDICRKLEAMGGGRWVKPALAIEVKGLIARAQMVYSDRFHGIVNALSQGVPVITCGWSYKYQELLADWGVPESLLPLRNGRAVDEVIQSCINTVFAGRVRLKLRKEIIVVQNNGMWDRLDDLLKAIK